MIGRRALLTAAATAGGALAAPSLAKAAAQRTLTFIPQADLTILDPIWTTAYVSRNHGMMVFDTLYGTDSRFQPQPQMAAGHVVEDDGRTWRIKLRPGLRFHDGAPVLARDCVASIRRWGARDPFGQSLLGVTDDLSAADDQTIVFRLKSPFPLLTAALGKAGSNVCFIMPERIAATDPFKQVTEMMGSGPYKFLADERVTGSRVAYARNDAYVPRDDGPLGWSAGPKRVNFDRVVWQTIPDAATAAAALQRGEVDWWELPTVDLIPVLQRARDLRVEIKDPTGQLGGLRMNELIPPFDNPAIRRALLGAISQEDYMIAVGGEDPSHRHVPAGVFTPGTPMASDVGMEILSRPRDLSASKRALADAGYKGEKVVLMAPTDFPILKAMADVGADLMTKMGFNVDYQAMDWGSVVQRRAKKDPVDKGGWNVFHTFWSGIDQANPAGHAFLRGQGEKGFVGWPTSPVIEEKRTEWLSAPDLASQKRLADDMQRQAFIDVPYIPVGQNIYTCAFKSDLTGMLQGFPNFWNISRA